AMNGCSIMTDAWTDRKRSILNMCVNCKEALHFKVIDQAKSYTIFIYAHHKTLSLTRSFTKKRDIIRPEVTRFASNFLTLQSLIEKKSNLRAMFTSDCGRIGSKTNKGKSAYSTVMSMSFWNGDTLFKNICPFGKSFSTDLRLAAKACEKNDDTFDPCTWWSTHILWKKNWKRRVSNMDLEKVDGELGEGELEENKKRSAGGGKQGTMIKKVKKDKVGATAKSSCSESSQSTTVPKVPCTKPELATPVMRKLKLIQIRSFTQKEKIHRIVQLPGIKETS
ncbi:hypothetical protein F511_24772, partial [Dorcoceras hygrometricum]